MSNINTYGFPFTSVDHDRKYGSADFRAYFQCLMTNGVINKIGDELEITQALTPAKTVLVSTGAIYINGVIREITSDLTLDVSENVSGNPRIDVIVARLNLTDRQVEFDILEGTPASSPVAPSVTQNSTIWEIALAQVDLANGYSTITDSNITDTRSFGVVKASHNFTVTLDKDNWSAGATGGFEQTVAVGGIVETDDGVVQVDLTGITDFGQKVALQGWFSKILNISAGTDEISVYIFNEPDVDIPLKIKVVR